MYITVLDAMRNGSNNSRKCPEEQLPCDQNSLFSLLWDSAIVKYHPLPSLSYDMCVVPESASFAQGDYLKNIDFFYGKKEKGGMRTRTI